MELQIKNYPELFKEFLKDGVNIFTGAGFSLLPVNGKALPTTQELCNLLCKRFNYNNENDFSLSQLSDIIKSTRSKKEFDDFIISTFKVKEYNPLYDFLFKINIKSFITTNVDNIFQLAASKNEVYYTDITEYGASKKDEFNIDFIPLHGNVLHEEGYCFGNGEISFADVSNDKFFSLMKAQLLKYPTVFIGYGFNDDAVKRHISSILKEDKNKIWILQPPENKKEISYFSQLGFQVLQGDTECFLRWVRDNLGDTVKEDRASRLNENLKRYRVPSSAEVESVSAEKFYSQGLTNWHSILFKHPVETKYVNDILEESLKHENVFITGMPFSGKTVLAKQIAISEKSKGREVLYIEEMTKEHAEFIIKILKDEKVLIVFDNCTADINALNLFLQNRNTKIIGFADDFSYEAIKHKISICDFSRININEISQEDALKIYNCLPNNIKADTFSYKREENEKYSLLEFRTQNMRCVIDKQNIKNIYARILGKTSRRSMEFDILALAAYLTSNNSILSMDLLFNFFDGGHVKIYKSIENIESLLNDFDVVFEKDIVDEDFYVLRSKIFTRLSIEVLKQHFQKEFAQTIDKFIRDFNYYNVYRYDVFRRSAYDSGFFYSLFPNGEAEDLYKIIHSFENDAYSLQQWALYEKERKDFSSAFDKIDQAKRLAPYNYSIRNTYAIIMFESNRKFNTATAIDSKKEAMTILEKCFKEDKRKNMHVKKYTEFAQSLFIETGESSYLKTSLEWLFELKAMKETDRFIDNYIKKVRDLLASAS